MNERHTLGRWPDRASLDGIELAVDTDGVKDVLRVAKAIELGVEACQVTAVGQIHLSSGRKPVTIAYGLRTSGATSATVPSPRT